MASEGGCYAARPVSCGRWTEGTPFAAPWHRSRDHARQRGYDAIIFTTLSAIGRVIVRDRSRHPRFGETAENATVRGLVEAWRKMPDATIVAIRDNARTPAKHHELAEHPVTAADV